MPDLQRVPALPLGGGDAVSGLLGSGTYGLPDGLLSGPAAGGSWSDARTLWRGGDSGASIEAMAGAMQVGELRRLNGPVAFNAELPAGGSYVGYVDRMGQRFFDVNDPAQGVVRVSEPTGAANQSLPPVLVTGKRDMELARFEAMKDAVRQGDRSVNTGELVDLARRYDPTNYFASHHTPGEKLAQFGLTSAIGTGSFFTGGAAYIGLMRLGLGARSSMVLSSMAGDAVFQGLDIGTNRLSGGVYGSSEFSFKQMAVAGVLPVAFGGRMAVRELAGELRGMGMPDWNIREAPLQFGTVSGNPKLFELERVGVAGADAPVAVSKGGGVYIPSGPDGVPIPLQQRQVSGVGDVPLPLREAEGLPHTVLGGKLARDGETVYRQTATFPGGTWPPLDGQDVPWGRVDWTGHEYLPGPPHPSPHIHEFYYDPVNKHWKSTSAKPFWRH